MTNDWPLSDSAWGSSSSGAILPELGDERIGLDHGLKVRADGLFQLGFISSSSGIRAL